MKYMNARKMKMLETDELRGNRFVSYISDTSDCTIDTEDFVSFSNTLNGDCIGDDGHLEDFVIPGSDEHPDAPYYRECDHK